MRISVSKAAHDRRKSKRYSVPMFLFGSGSEDVPLKNWSYAGFTLAVNNDAWRVADKLSFWLSADANSDGGSISARVLRITASETTFAFEEMSDEAFDTMEKSLRGKLSR
jgi:hypothetical protein